jgi:hypothetical protein
MLHSVANHMKTKERRARCKRERPHLAQAFSLSGWVHRLGVHEAVVQKTREDSRGYSDARGTD